MNTLRIKEESEALERVLTRLAVTQDEAFEGVLDKLLPLMIAKLDGSQYVDKKIPDLIKQKILAILSHVNARLKGLPRVKLPVQKLVKVYRGAKGEGLVESFSLVYIDKGFDRSDDVTRMKCVEDLLKGIKGKEAGRQRMALRLACQALQGFGQLARSGDSEVAKDILNNPDDRKIFVGYVKSLCLYTPPGVGGKSGDRLVPGLCIGDVEAIEAKGVPQRLEEMVLNALEYIYQCSFHPEETFALFLCASCSSMEKVSKRGQDIFRKTCVIDSSRPTVDIEKDEIIMPLFELFLGSLDDETLSEKARLCPANQSVKSKILSVLSRSIKAANSNPQAIMVIHESLFGEQSSFSLQQQGMGYAVWVLKHADSKFIKMVAPTMLKQCNEILERPINLNTSVLSMRSFSYQCIGQIASRSPESMRGRLDLAKICFKGLHEEPAGVRASVQEATACLADCFLNSSKSEAIEIMDLLTIGIVDPVDTMRAASLNWVIRVFPFSNVNARYLSIISTADKSKQIADTARESLIVDIEHSNVEYPCLVDMLVELRNKHPQLMKPVKDDNELPLQPEAYRSAIKFLLKCTKRSPRPTEEAKMLFGKIYVHCLALLIVLHLEG